MNKCYQLKDIQLHINKKIILDKINLNVNEEGITIIEGHNGAGKTSLLKIMANLIKPTNGSMKIYNKKYYEKSSFVFQKPIFLNRSVISNLKYALACNNCPMHDINIAIDYLHHFNLIHLLKSQAKVLSIGEQQIISFIRAIIINPHILYLDEPTSNLDLNFTKLIESEILDLSKKIKVIMISQSKEQINLLQNHLITLNSGKLK